MKILLLALFTTSLFGEFYQNIHSSVATYYEDKSYTNSKQKTDGRTYGFVADLHDENSEYKFAYETTQTQTIQPPMSTDAHIQKLFLKYAYSVNDRLELHANYISILDDNIAPTDGGSIYGLGISYKLPKKIYVNFTQYLSKYQNFEVKQSDLKLAIKRRFAGLKLKLSLTTKYIDIDDTTINAYTKNAQSDYLTTGLQFHSNYESYHFGAGAYMGKRAFAVMNDGFQVQHHSMEVNRTYALGFGKSMDNFVLKAQYIYARATEMPIQNENVEIRTLRLIGSYKF